MASTHHYRVGVRWTGGRDGEGRVQAPASGVELPLSVPKEFQGPGDGTNPEELLTAAIASCYSITFGIIAANRKLPFVSLDVEADGEVDQDGMNFVYRAVTVRAKVQLAAGATDDEKAVALDMAHKADQYCIITNAVRGKVAITVEPEVVAG